MCLPPSGALPTDSLPAQAVTTTTKEACMELLPSIRWPAALLPTRLMVTHCAAEQRSMNTHPTQPTQPKPLADEHLALPAAAANLDNHCCTRHTLHQHACSIHTTAHKHVKDVAHGLIGRHAWHMSLKWRQWLHSSTSVAAEGLQLSGSPSSLPHVRLAQAPCCRCPATKSTRRSCQAAGAWSSDSCSP